MKEIVSIRFPGNKKNYHYYWPKNRQQPNKETKLLIKNHFGEQEVVIIDYHEESDKATSILTVLKVYKTPLSPLNPLRPTEEEVFDTFINNATPTKEATMTDFNSVKYEAKKSFKQTKDIVVTMQKGKAVITAVKTSLLEADFVPENLKKLLLIEGYSDLAIGALINIAGNTFTDSSVIQSAAKDANFVGAVEFSNQFTFVEKFIEDIIKKALGSEELLTEKKED